MSQLAEKEGFEPSDPVSQVPSLAVRSIRPLSHFSMPDESDGCQLFHTATNPAALISKTDHLHEPRRWDTPSLRTDSVLTNRFQPPVWGLRRLCMLAYQAARAFPHTHFRRASFRRLLRSVRFGQTPRSYGTWWATFVRGVSVFGDEGCPSWRRWSNRHRPPGNVR
jgi:hypothetical protein